jgi:hypothetical protein
MSWSGNLERIRRVKILCSVQFASKRKHFQDAVIYEDNTKEARDYYVG